MYTASCLEKNVRAMCVCHHPSAPNRHSRTQISAVLSEGALCKDGAGEGSKVGVDFKLPESLKWILKILSPTERKSINQESKNMRIRPYQCQNSFAMLCLFNYVISASLSGS
jgi:hypothetical protein